MNASLWLRVTFLAALFVPGMALAQTKTPTARLALPVDPEAGAAGDAPSESVTALAKKLQNPIGNLIGVPFQNNINFGVSPSEGTQDIPNIQPVVPIHLDDNWDVITRTTLPLVWNPPLQPASSVLFGAAPTTFFAFLSPANPTNEWLWGTGPIAQLPTISSKTLGSNVWGLGPAFVLVKMQGPIVAGALVNNVFSMGGTAGRGGTQYSTFTLNPFFNYNSSGGWFAGTVSIITTNWNAPGEKMDRASRRSGLSAYQSRWQASGKFSRRRVLQRPHAEKRRQMAAPYSGRSDLLTRQAQRSGRLREFVETARAVHVIHVRTNRGACT